MKDVPVDLAAFFIVEENDDTGESAQGPYTMAEAESILQVDQKIITRHHLATLQETDKAVKNQAVPATQSKIQRDIRGWGIILLLLGGVSVFSNGLSNSEWGILLIVVALASFYFREAAMFVIYGTTISFAALSNFLSASGGWTAFAFVQIFFAFQTFRQYFHHRSIEAVDNTLPTQNRSARLFPWASFAFGVVSIAGFVGIFLLAIMLSFIAVHPTLDALISFGEGLIVDMAILSVALGLASLLSKFQRSVFAIIGLTLGSLVLLIEVAFSFLN